MKVTIELEGGELPRVHYKNDKVERRIVMNHDDLLEMLKESCYKTVTHRVLKPKFISPDLPRGTIKYSKRNDGADIFTMYKEPSIEPITFEKTTFEKVPMPPLIMTFIVKDNRLIKSHMHAVKDRILLPETQLYVFPLSNVHYDTGTLCYYSNHVFYKTLTEFERWYYHWIREPFNNHLFDAYTDKYPRTKSNLQLRELLAKLNHQTEFPIEELVPSKWTYQKMIDSIYGKEDKEDD